MKTERQAQVRGRALVLSAGGPLGAAWEIGFAAGLESAGAPLFGADRVIGTSAGAIVGCQLAAGTSAQVMVEGQIARARRLSQDGYSARHISKDPAALLDELASLGPVEVCRRALHADSAIPEDTFIRNLEGIIPHGLPWPERFVCVATNAHTAERQVWDASSGVEVIRALAASCCSPYVAQPISVNGGRFLDGAVHSITNADLAEGFATVLVIAVAVPLTAALIESQINRERAAIECHGGQMILITPDKASLDAIGPNLMDGARGEAAAMAGAEQGRKEADRLVSCRTRASRSAPQTITSEVFSCAALVERVRQSQAASDRRDALARVIAKQDRRPVRLTLGHRPGPRQLLQFRADFIR